MVESGVLASRMEELGSEVTGLMLRTAVDTPVNFLEDLALRIDRWLAAFLLLALNGQTEIPLRLKGTVTQNMFSFKSGPKGFKGL